MLLLLAASSGLAGCASESGHAAAYRSYVGVPPIVASADAAEKAATLDIIGSDGGASLGFNFDGYARGAMIVKVPQGWRINVVYRVDGPIHHSLAIVPWAQRKASRFTDAFRGANIPNPKSGINRDHRPVTFSFLADRPGRYAMVCEVIGHDDLGMWDELDVVAGLKRPAVLVR